MSATTYPPLDAALRAELSRRFGPAFSVREKDLEAASRDASGLTRRPEAGLEAKSVRDVQDILVLANRHGFPVTPRGAGTGLAGGALAAHGGVVLDLAPMNRVLSIDPADMLAVVEPGVVTMTLRDAVRKLGLFYPPDPASLDVSTLGGNAATNAGGPACVKYGVTRDYVLGLEAVLPSGELLPAGAATRKGVVGYDLTKLLVGSEGTLGVITRLFLKLIPHPRATRTALALFPDPERAVAAVGAGQNSGITPRAWSSWTTTACPWCPGTCPSPARRPGLPAADRDRRRRGRGRGGHGPCAGRMPEDVRGRGPAGRRRGRQGTDVAGAPEHLASGSRIRRPLRVRGRGRAPVAHPGASGRGGGPGT
jgi:FAD/FMN-containing dehydrogenase